MTTTSNNAEEDEKSNFQSHHIFKTPMSSSKQKNYKACKETGNCDPYTGTKN